MDVMRPMTDREIRSAFVNCSKGAAKRIPVPRDLDDRPWDDLDFLGWRDAGAPDRAYLVTRDEDRARGIVLRSAPPAAWQVRRSMCSVCLTAPSAGVSLMVAPRAGRAGQDGNSVGTYLCADLNCSLYIRGLKDAGPSARLPEVITVEERIARTVTNLESFLARVHR